MLEARTRRQVGIVSACLAVGALLVACGDDDDDAASVTSAAAGLVAPTEAGAVTTEAAAVTTEAAATVTTEAEAVVPPQKVRTTTPTGVETSAAIDVVAPIVATSEPTASTGTSASSAPASSAPASEVCAAHDELADSVYALGEVSVSDLTSGGTSAITDALGAVHDDLSDARLGCGQRGTPAGAGCRGRHRRGRDRRPGDQRCGQRARRSRRLRRRGHIGRDVADDARDTLPDVDGGVGDGDDPRVDRLISGGGFRRDDGVELAIGEREHREPVPRASRRDWASSGIDRNSSSWT